MLFSEINSNNQTIDITEVILSRAFLATLIHSEIYAHKILIEWVIIVNFLSTAIEKKL